MTLALDLNEQQQKEVSKLLLEKGKQKEALRKQHMANKKAGKNNREVQHRFLRQQYR